MLLFFGKFWKCGSYEYFGRNNYLSEGPRSYRRSGMLTETDVLQVNPEPDQTSSLSAAPEQMDFYWVPR